MQREAVEREQRLEEERKRKIEEKRRREELRAIQTVPTNENFLIQQASVSEPRFVPEEKKEKVKTRGVATQQEKSKEIIGSSSTLLPPSLPKLGAQAQNVFSKIEDEDWDFTREDYSLYLTDLQCTQRKNKSSHRVFQLPKTTIITIERDGQKLQEHVFLGDEDIELGSVTLPAWKGSHIPFYLRKQLRAFHEKINRIYTKISELNEGSSSSNIK
ncbi:MAG: hypothetical protein HON43_04310 [Alphaproteobacteria bacterium]|jgi:hypothetical protein|nr:hypothetical protein [Alphaproteobacteria bacterium]MBT5390318.1 hypothetical protein [Alphaproteobacteria bacterium]